MKKMFFYGIFRKNHPASEELVRRGATYLGPASIRGLTLYGSLRGVWARPSPDTIIHGDLWDVPETTVTGYLDYVENHPNNYKRESFETVNGVDCEVYVSQHPVENFAEHVGETWTHYYSQQ